jgi:hypothetical protein
MFKKIAADALGLSDIGKIIEPHDYDKTESDDYVMHEDNEKIYFLIKTKADEYCFTNLALIHVDGEKATSSKRTLRRYSYYENEISDVTLETAGRVDLDIEIKFKMGSQVFDIDVQKDQIEKLKDLYKTLIRISEIYRENKRYVSIGESSMGNAVSIMKGARLGENTALDQEYQKLTDFGFAWLTSLQEQYQIKDFGRVFEKYINN